MVGGRIIESNATQATHATLVGFFPIFSVVKAAKPLHSVGIGGEA